MLNSLSNKDIQQLWQRVQTFCLDEPNVVLPFSKRLARECGWSRPYTLRTMEEYKRFIFLACMATQPVTPSVAVDAVWHLHLIYTKSYWETFCDTILQRRIHHNPTQGGSSEGLKFKDNYERTLALYETYFGTKPPKDIWPPTAQRFAGTRFQWVNRNDYWLFPKFFFKLVGNFSNSLKTFLTR